MTKKHFIALADKLKSLRNDTVWNSHTYSQFMAIVDGLADFCQAQNPEFNRERWLAYISGECGPNGGAIRS
jgi:hypothetical protein